MNQSEVKTQETIKDLIKAVNSLVKIIDSVGGEIQFRLGTISSSIDSFENSISFDDLNERIKSLDQEITRLNNIANYYINNHLEDKQ